MLIRMLLSLSMLFTAGQALAADKLQVVSVNYPLQYFAQRLLGDDAEVVYPVPAGTDPSFWRPSIADISAAQAADLVLLNGAGFAAWPQKVSLPRAKLVRTTRGLENQFIATETITHSHGDGGEHSHEGKAAYTWLEPMFALAQAEAIAKAAKRRKLLDPVVMDSNLAGLANDLVALDQHAAKALQGAKDIVMIGTHPRYQYLARAYGLTMLALEWEAGEAPTAQQLADLEALIAARDIEVLLWEAAPPAAARQAVQALGVKDTVFPTLATPPADGDLISVYKAAIDDLAAAAGL